MLTQIDIGDDVGDDVGDKNCHPHFCRLEIPVRVGSKKPTSSISLVLKDIICDIFVIKRRRTLVKF